ncbi:MAG TPA: ABC transporter substrate-binding protein [Solirubrobacteraceae bacterium]|nr:ABC transporter substrate-binding protein [Solirubrobacteraceae bacterium]
MRRFAGFIALAAVAVLVAGCGGSSSKTTSSSTSTSAAAAPANTGTVGGKLVVDNESGSTWTCQFNPFNPAVTLTSFGWVYEPLQFVNILKSTSKPAPWLATSSAWSNGFKTLTFTIRDGVKWSDGQPFSAADVAYTFNAMKQDKAIDLNAIWKADGGPLTSVATKGSNQVVMTFSSPSQPYFYFVADLTPIVPQHIWSTLDQTKLHAYPDKQPVGTGPYKVANCAPQNIKYVRNPNYWQSTSGKPVPQIQEVDYPAFLSNTSANLFLSQGQAQWGGQYVPNIQTFYVNKDPAHRHYWFPPVLNVSLFPNLENPVLGQLPVRQAIAYAIDKSKVSQLGESGYQQPANQSGVITPTFQSWADTSLQQPTYNPAKAEQILQSAGFTKGSDGIYRDKNGNKLSFTIKTISGFSDWDASLAIIKQNLKKVGIDVTIQDENTGPYTSDLQSGKYQLAYGGSGGPSATPGPSPYYELRGLLFSGNIGSTNYERYKSAATDSLFNQYSAASSSKQAQLIDQVQKTMVDQVPFIPVTEGVDWYQYDTSNIEGWPTKSNPYAQPSPYSAPDLAVVLTHLYPIH